MEGKKPEGAGLRYRKKRKTRLAVERAALELVLERGYDGVKVEDICERAEISRKTFFNYYRSKVEAVVGRMDAFPTTERLTEILDEHSSKCYLDVLASVVGTTVGSSMDDHIMELRRRALMAMPQLFFQSRPAIADAQRSVAETLGTYLKAHPERRLLPHRPLSEEVLVGTSATVAIARTNSMLRVCGEDGPTMNDTRRVLAAYLAAGEGTVCTCDEGATAPADVPSARAESTAAQGR